MAQDNNHEPAGGSESRDHGHEDTVFILFRGLPQVFRSLSAAEDLAARSCEADQETRTILAVPESSLAGNGIAVRYRGVILLTLEEARTEEESE